MTSGSEIAIDETLDARGLHCPMPLLKAKQALNRLDSGQVLEVLATDSGSYRDVPLFVKQTKHELLLVDDSNNEYRYIIRKA